MHRRGVTLIEMLVATAVFLFGFAAVFALFLAGIRMRKDADDMTRLSLGTSAVIEEIRLSSGGKDASGLPFTPEAYLGDGFAQIDSGNGDNGPLSATVDGSNHLFRYAQDPRIWYRVIEATDLFGDPSNNLTSSLDLRIIFVNDPVAGNELTLQDIARRARLNQQDSALLIDKLVERRIAAEQRVVIRRQPSWR